MREGAHDFLDCIHGISPWFSCLPFGRMARSSSFDRHDGDREVRGQHHSDRTKSKVGLSPESDGNMAQSNRATRKVESASQIRGKYYCKDLGEVILPPKSSPSYPSA